MHGYEHVATSAVATGEHRAAQASEQDGLVIGHTIQKESRHVALLTKGERESTCTRRAREYLAVNNKRIDKQISLANTTILISAFDSFRIKLCRIMNKLFDPLLPG